MAFIREQSHLTSMRFLHTTIYASVRILSFISIIYIYRYCSRKGKRVLRTLINEKL